MCVCWGGGGGGFRTIYMPISIKYSGLPTKSPKTGFRSKVSGQEDEKMKGTILNLEIGLSIHK